LLPKSIKIVVGEVEVKMAVKNKKAKLSNVEIFYRFISKGNKEAVLFVHGNLCSSDVWINVFKHVPEEFDIIAPDLRSFGRSGRALIDATRGLRGYSDDLIELIGKFDYSAYYLIGHSMGGGIVLQMLLDKPEKFGGIMLVDPVSPYGFGGTKDEYGTPCYDDYAGSGAGLVARYNPDFVKMLKMKHRGTDHPSAPANALKAYFAEDFDISNELRERILDTFFMAEVGDEYYPGNYVESGNWPYVAPGEKGVLNAFSPKYLDLSIVVEVEPKPPILWIHGEKDQVISNMSLLDPAVLGLLGSIPDYPGEDVFPPQPMIDQIRRILEVYKEKGGNVEIKFIEGAGHTPFLEKPKIFKKIFLKFLE